MSKTALAVIHWRVYCVLCLNVCRLCVPNIMSLGICLKKLHLIKVGTFAWYSVKIRIIFGVRFERRKSWFKKSKPTEKLKHANSILEYFEYFCQMSSKSIVIFSSYTISKLVHFFWDTVYSDAPLKVLSEWLPASHAPTVSAMVS